MRGSRSGCTPLLHTAIRPTGIITTNSNGRITFMVVDYIVELIGTKAVGNWLAFNSRLVSYTFSRICRIYI